MYYYSVGFNRAVTLSSALARIEKRIVLPFSIQFFCGGRTNLPGR